MFNIVQLEQLYQISLQHQNPANVLTTTTYEQSHSSLKTFKQTIYHRKIKFNQIFFSLSLLI